MHHSGAFVNLGKHSYLGGQISYIDYCNLDEMSLIEIDGIAIEVGLEDSYIHYYNSTEVNDTNGLTINKDDIDTVNLYNFIDENKMVVVFVDYQKLTAPSNVSEQSESVAKHSIEFRNNVDGAVDEEKQSVGEGVSKVKHDENEELEIRIDPDMIDSLSSDSDENQLMGLDLEYSEKLHDNECEVSNGDVLFKSNIDDDTECGLPVACQRDRGEASLLGKKMSKGNEGTSRKHRDHPIFNRMVDGSDPKFELWMCFSDNALLRQAVRQHSVNHGRDFIFTINHAEGPKCKTNIEGFEQLDPNGGDDTKFNKETPIDHNIIP
ncbi:hypothetical protein CDL12_22285 [Handroanthus impetiginosus]|uniref:PB1-like domain-containing protein n=1 Tax=Handroanthus impetiginosus TaxID=429701 RepID=A0A2G9GJH2_9LAMI|nr:hypothetical protein CDL12_22285 [Handroanthus impetiginosus]